MITQQLRENIADVIGPVCAAYGGGPQPSIQPKPETIPGPGF